MDQPRHGSIPRPHLPDVRPLDRFRSLIINGFQQPAEGGFTCRDGRNTQVHVSLDQLEIEIGSLDHLAQRLLAV